LITKQKKQKLEKKGSNDHPVFSESDIKGHVSAAKNKPKGDFTIKQPKNQDLQKSPQNTPKEHRANPKISAFEENVVGLKISQDKNFQTQSEQNLFVDFPSSSAINILFDPFGPNVPQQEDAVSAEKKVGITDNYQEQVVAEQALELGLASLDFSFLELENEASTTIPTKEEIKSPENSSQELSIPYSDVFSISTSEKLPKTLESNAEKETPLILKSEHATPLQPDQELKISDDSNQDYLHEPLNDAPEISSTLSFTLNISDKSENKPRKMERKSLHILTIKGKTRLQRNESVQNINTHNSKKSVKKETNTNDYSKFENRARKNTLTVLRVRDGKIKEFIGYIKHKIKEEQILIIHRKSGTIYNNAESSPELQKRVIEYGRANISPTFSPTFVVVPEEVWKSVIAQMQQHISQESISKNKQDEIKIFNSTSKIFFKSMLQALEKTKFDNTDRTVKDKKNELRELQKLQDFFKKKFIQEQVENRLIKATSDLIKKRMLERKTDSIKEKTTKREKLLFEQKKKSRNVIIEKIK